MIEYTNTLNIAVVFVITFALSYLLGTSVLHLIDHKMNDISINMPKINLPKPQITVHLTDQFGDNKIYVSQPADKSTKTSTQSGGNLLTLQPQSVKVLQKDSPKTITDVQKRIERIIETFDNKIQSNILFKEKVCQKEIISEPSSIALFKDKDVTKNITGNVGLTYYKDPSEMTPKQLLKFQHQAQFSKMTILDYRNWLSVYKDDIAGLTQRYPQHLPNFQKLIKGDLVTMEDFLKARKQHLEIQSIR